MTEPHPHAGPPLEVFIPDDVMAEIRNAPPEVADQLAAAIAELRQLGPENVPGSRELFPHPVDHTYGTPDVYVPATRSIGYLRGAVADISPPTVANFDAELTQDTAPRDDRDRVAGLRSFVRRWVEYIALQGTHSRARYIERAADVDDFTNRFAEMMAEVSKECFPDAHDGLSDPGDLSIRVGADGDRAYALCPITMIRVVHDTPEEAVKALHGALSEMVTGY